MFSLLYRNHIVAYLCLVGWLEVYGMIVSVNAGFLCMAILQSVWVLLIVMSRKFVVFLAFCCKLEFRMHCIEVLQYVLNI